jgi:hypothetical protein
MTAKPEASLSAQFAFAVGDSRVAVLRAEQERETARRRELELQASPGTEPRERIRIWERLHAVSLPVAETHPLVIVIANQTQLRVRDIKEEQRRRALADGGTILGVSATLLPADRSEGLP